MLRRNVFCTLIAVFVVVSCPLLGWSDELPGSSLPQAVVAKTPVSSRPDTDPTRHAALDRLYDLPGARRPQPDWSQERRTNAPAPAGLSVSICFGQRGDVDRGG